MTTMLNTPADAPTTSTPGPATKTPVKRPATRRRPVRRDTKKAPVAEPERLRSGRYRAYVWDPDLQEKVSVENPHHKDNTFTTKTEARAAQRALQAKIDDLYAKAGSPNLRQTHRHTFRAVVDEFLPLQGGTRGTKAARRCNANRLCRRFGEMDIAAIQEEDYLAYMRDCEDQGMAPATAEASLITMRQIMVFARKAPRRYIEDSPIEDIPLPKVHRVKDPRVLEDQDFLFLLNYVPWRFVPAMLLGYDEGLRAGEIAGLRWKRLDLDSEQPKVLVQDVVEKSGQDGKKRLREHTKGGGNSNGGDWITLTSRTVEALKALRDATPHAGPNDPVFPLPRGGHMEPSKPSAIMKIAWLASGLTGDRPTFHSLRHSCATNLARAGVKADIIMQRMRHRTFDVTLQYIKAASLEAQGEAMGMVDEMHEARVDAARRRRQELTEATKPAQPVATDEGVFVPADKWAVVETFMKMASQLPGMEKFSPDAGLVAA